MMDFGFPFQSSLADSAMLHFDAVQLNRIEWMLMHLMMKLSGSVPDPSVSGPLGADVVDEVSVSKSKQRRMRMAQTKRRMWLQLRERVEGEASPSDTISETLGADPSDMMRAMFQKLVEVETKADGVSAISEEANLTACQAMAVSETLDFEATSEIDVSIQRIDETTKCSDGLVDNSACDGRLSETPDYGNGVLETLKGKQKADAVINLLLNRTCTRDDYMATLECLCKYFEDDLDHLVSFLGVKFGTGWKSWDDVVSDVSAEIAKNARWDAGLSLGMVMVEFRRKKSECVGHGASQATQRTQRLNQPWKSKMKRQKR